MVQDKEVDFESYHVDENRSDDEATNAGSPMPQLVPLRKQSSQKKNLGQVVKGTNQRHFEVTKFVPQILYGVDTNQGCHKQSDEFDTTNEFSGCT